MADLEFVSEKELEIIRKSQGAVDHVEGDRVAIPDRPLFEILRENKERKDAEFNEKFKNRPHKSLDDDEIEFLDAIARHRQEIEQQQEEEEKAALVNFQVAVAERTVRMARETKPHSLLSLTDTDTDTDTDLQQQQQQQKNVRKTFNPKRPAPISQSSILANVIRIKPVADVACKKQKCVPSKQDTRTLRGEADVSAAKASGSGLDRGSASRPEIGSSDNSLHADFTSSVSEKKRLEEDRGDVNRHEVLSVGGGGGGGGGDGGRHGISFGGALVSYESDEDDDDET